MRPELVNLPYDLGKFIIVHALVRLLLTNHGPLLSSYMTAYLPHWEEQAMRLRLYQCIEAAIKNNEPPGCCATLADDEGDDEEAPA